MASPSLKDCQTDHLFLLVGGNPLPNYVAARLLAKPEGTTTLWLLYSSPEDGTPTTKGVAEQLQRGLQRLTTPSFRKIELCPISDTKSHDIEEKVRSILKERATTGSVGLNYSGGTKPMAIHTYRTIEALCRDQKRGASRFSYLDPRKLALRVDAQGTEGHGSFPILATPQLREQVEMELDDLAALHGYVRAPSEGWASGSHLVPLCKAIAQVHAHTESFKQWGEWIKTQCVDLPNTDTEAYKLLTPVREAMDELCGGPGAATAELIAARLRPPPPPDAPPPAVAPTLKSCSTWFISAWLEEYALEGFRLSVASGGVKDNASGLKYRRTAGDPNLEIDVMAMLGHQLFAISCITSREHSDESENKSIREAKRSEVKKHLFEAYLRARQLGGDEARVALVCCRFDTGSLLREVEREWEAEGKIKIFGQEALKDVPAAIAKWIRLANP